MHELNRHGAFATAEATRFTEPDPPRSLPRAIPLTTAGRPVKCEMSPVNPPRRWMATVFRTSPEPSTLSTSPLPGCGVGAGHARPHLGGCVAGGISKVQLARHDVVDIAPDPGLAWFNGADQWMFVAWKCLVACLFLDESQHPTCPHDRQSRRCTQVSPVLRHSSQPFLAVCFILIWSRCVQGSGIFRSPNAARSHLARRAPASYVLSKNSYRVSSGDSARRMSSYNRMNSESADSNSPQRGVQSVSLCREVEERYTSKTPGCPRRRHPAKSLRSIPRANRPGH